MEFKDILSKIAELDIIEEAKKESTAKKDHKAEKAGKKVAKDIEYDEGHKGKDDKKAEKAGKKVTKDIEYDDKKDKKKKSLKDWIEIVGKEIVNEAEQIQVVPAKSTTQVIKQGNKTLGTVTNPQLASQIKQSIGKGEMSLAGTEIKEEEVEESGLQAYLGNKKYGKAGMDALRKAGREGASKEKMAQIRAQHDKLDEADKPNYWVKNEKTNQYHGPYGSERAAKEGGVIGKIEKYPSSVRNPKSVNRSPEHAANAAKAGGAIKVNEKAVSKAQQKFMGMVHAAQKGEKPASKAVGDVAKSMKKGDVKDFAKTKHKGLPEKKKKTNEAERPSDQVDMGAGLGAGRNAKVLEAKPDFIDLDKDGNKKESMKKAAQDAKKKKKVHEAMNTLEAAYHEGKSHGLSKHGYSCRYNEGSEEHRRYHKGFVEGLDECYGMGIKNKPIIGMGENVPATVPGMANAAMPAMEDDMGEGNAFTGKLASTPPGGTFKLGDKTFKDTSSLEEYAFESLDKQLDDLLNEGIINEGLSVSMSTGQQGAPDSVSVTASDDDAGKLLAFIKQVGLGGMGGDSPEAAHGEPAAVVTSVSDYGGPKFSSDNPDMAALLQKVGVDGEDYKEEQGGSCQVHGMAEAECGCENKKVDEVETEDQMEFEVAEDSAGADEQAETAADENAEAAEDSALAKAAQQNKTNTVNEGGDGGEASEETVDNSPGSGESSVSDKQEQLDEWANNAGQKGTDTAFEQDIEFMTKVISGGLNKPKSTGQTTIPVIAGQNARTGDEDVVAWKRLAGLLK